MLTEPPPVCLRIVFNSTLTAFTDDRLRTTMVDVIVVGTKRRVVDIVRVGYFIPLNGPLNGHPPRILL